jgi:hypothetical protein
VAGVEVEVAVEAEAVVPEVDLLIVEVVDVVVEVAIRDDRCPRKRRLQVVRLPMPRPFFCPSACRNLPMKLPQHLQKIKQGAPTAKENKILWHL